MAAGHTFVNPAPGRSLGLVGRLLLVVLVLGGLLFARVDPFSVFFFLSYAVLGALLAVRRPGNVIGWLLVVIAFGFVGTTVPTDVDAAALIAGTATWGGFLVVWVTAWAGYITFACLAALLLVFPSGHLPPGRLRRPAIALLAVCVAVAVLSAVSPTVSFNPDGGVATIAVPNRFAVMPELAAWQLVPPDALIVPTLLALALAVVSMIVRYRRASGVERLQLRWLVAAAAFVVVAITAGLISVSIVGEDLGALAWIPAIIAYPTVPAAIYVAVTRYRLYEIDRIVSRTIGWAIVTGLLAAVFAAVVVGLQAVLAPMTENSTLAVAASTLVAAALFQPLRARVQAVVDRRFNRHRVDAQRAIDAFGLQLRDEVDLGAVHGRLLAAAEATVQPAGAGLWLRGTGKAAS